MKILITGAGGLLGSALARLLRTIPDSTVVATSKRPIRNASGVTFQPLDVTLPKAINEAFDAARPEVVFHAAAMTDVDRCERERAACRLLNTSAVAYVAEACKRVDAHLVLLSTDFVFDGKKSPLDETAPTNPINYYGESKRDAEVIVSQSGISYTIVRTALVYGASPPGGRSNIALWVKQQLSRRRAIHMVDDQWRTPTLADDLAMGCYLAGRQRASGIYHIAGAEALTPYRIATRTAQFFDLPLALVHPTDSTRFSQPAKRPLCTELCIRKAQTTLNYSPRAFQKGLQLVEAQLNDRE